MARLSLTLDDDLLDWFGKRAKRLGQTEEELARQMIEREARTEQTFQALEENSNRMRQRLKSMGRYESPAQISKHRDQ